MSNKEEIEFNIHSGMISAQGEAQSKVFHKVVGKSGTWYIAMQENAADNLYLVNNNKNGMAGATLKFTLEDGSVEDVHAPWQSNADSLYKDTGIDVREQSYITYVISLGRHLKEGSGWNKPYIHTDILEYSLTPILSSHDTIKGRVEKFTTKYKQNIFVSIKGQGGGIASWCDYKED